MSFDNCNPDLSQFLAHQLFLRFASLVGATEAVIFSVRGAKVDIVLETIIHERPGIHDIRVRNAAIAEFKRLVRHSIECGSDAVFNVKENTWCIIVRYKEELTIRAAIALIVMAKDKAEAERKLRLVRGFGAGIGPQNMPTE